MADETENPFEERLPAAQAQELAVYTNLAKIVDRLGKKVGGLLDENDTRLYENAKTALEFQTQRLLRNVFQVEAAEIGTPVEEREL